MINKSDSERMNIVIVGHVDHGKSTVIGRLLADTNSLPEGKLEAIKAFCLKNARPFEYAFLLDALKDEQSQGITIDTARCFFNTQKRQYVIIDAPGHIEFLKNMITGASRAEAALLVIDAKEGVRENSKRHGFILSLLGIRQVAVLINKMDLAGYSEEVFNSIKKEYSEFLKRLNVEAVEFIPVCARDGENFTRHSDKMAWYGGSTVVERIDLFEKEKERENMPFRMPVQDIYKFTARGDERRIIAGTVESGAAKPGDEVIFLPSGKRSIITQIESFNEPTQTALMAGQAKGFTVNTQIYIKRGELACLASQALPETGFAFKANIFWLGRKPMIYGKRYKLKMGSARESVYLENILNIIDAAEIEAQRDKGQIERHDVAQCVFKTIKPIAYDLYADNQRTGRFVIVDDYEISGGGIITQALENEKTVSESHVEKREYNWQKGMISAANRASRFGQTPKFVLIAGMDNFVINAAATALEAALFSAGRNAYYLGASSIEEGLESGLGVLGPDRDGHIGRLGELARILTDTGVIFISTLAEPDDFEIEQLKVLNRPNEIMVIDAGAGLQEAAGIYKAGQGVLPEALAKEVLKLLASEKIITEYFI